MKKLLCGCLFLFIIGVAVCFYAFKVEPYYTVKRTVNAGNGELGDLNIIQVSDIQISENYTTRHLARLVDKINRDRPDIFVFTGDLYENYAAYGPEEDVVRELSRIEAQYGKYAIYGNRDYGGGSVRRYESIMEASGIRVLKNEGVHIALPGDRSLFLAGLDDYLLGHQDMEAVEWEMQQAEDDYRILLTHEPDTADFYKDYNFDLILAGHSHGGQVYLPFSKGITTAMAEKYVKGLYTIQNEPEVKLYVNPGIGTSRFPVRFLVPPEITKLRI